MNAIRRIRQFFCRHRFDIRNLKPRQTPEGNVSWPCWKCGKVFHNHSGLFILFDHGKAQRKP